MLFNSLYAVKVGRVQSGKDPLKSLLSFLYKNQNSFWESPYVKDYYQTIACMCCVSLVKMCFK